MSDKTATTKISQRIEEIFATAVAMDQSGRLRCTIYCLDDQIFIMNSDQSVILKFQLRKSENVFAHPISFRANDYDSREFYEKDGKIVFVTENEGFKREKSCKTPGDSPEDIAKLYADYPLIRTNSVKLSAGISSLLDEALSHIEISAPNKQLCIQQRNIYSGTVLTLSRTEQEGGLGLDSLVQDKIADAFEPLGMRTNDFLALFTFIDRLAFFFPAGEADYCCVRSDDPKMAMEGVIALCRYDELGGIQAARKESNPKQEQKEAGHGRRKEQEVGRGQSRTDRQTEEQQQPVAEQRSRRSR